MRHYQECIEFLKYAYNEEQELTQAQRPMGYFSGERRSPSPQIQQRSPESSLEYEPISFDDVDYQKSGSCSISSSNRSRTPQYNFEEIQSRIFQECEYFLHIF